MCENFRANILVKIGLTKFFITSIYNYLILTSVNDLSDLEESIVDMFASRWERILQGRLDASNKEIADINEKFLQRYTENDKERVLQYLKKIREA